MRVSRRNFLKGALSFLAGLAIPKSTGDIQQDIVKEDDNSGGFLVPYDFLNRDPNDNQKVEKQNDADCDVCVRCGCEIGIAYLPDMCDVCGSTLCNSCAIEYGTICQFCQMTGEMVDVFVDSVLCVIDVLYDDQFERTELEMYMRLWANSIGCEPLTIAEKQQALLNHIIEIEKTKIWLHEKGDAIVWGYIDGIGYVAKKASEMNPMERLAFNHKAKHLKEC